jgi:hypothetical protein
MPFNGSGTYSRLYSWVIDAANNVNISSSRTDAEMNGFAAGLTNCITRDGQSPPSSDLPMGGRKLVNLGAATVGTDALSQAAGDARYLQSGSALPHTITFNNAGSGAASGAVFDVTANLTISFNSIGAAPLASPTFTGTPAGPTAAPGTNTTQLATTAFVVASFATIASLASYATTASLASYAPLASPALTGTPTAPTAATGTATTQLATTAFADVLRDVPSNAKAANYQLALTDRGQGIDFNGTSLTCTIPANGSVAFPVGTVIVITNLNATSLSIAITTDTLTLSGTTTTGTRTLGQNGEARLRKVSATSWLIAGTALS